MSGFFVMHILTDLIAFPPVHESDSYGVLALGGDLSPARLLLAYHSGIFPWYEDGEPIIWWSPPKRMVLFPEQVKISKSTRKILESEAFTITFNTQFKAVIENCAQIKRDGQRGTWITTEMQNAYLKLHEMGIAKSVEVWKDEVLVGGLYGVDLGAVFCGESMFSKVPNASKVAFITLAKSLQQKNYKVLDCQVYNDHLASLGAIEIGRDEFLKILRNEY